MIKYNYGVLQINIPIQRFICKITGHKYIIKEGRKHKVYCCSKCGFLKHERKEAIK